MVTFQPNLPPQNDGFMASFVTFHSGMIQIAQEMSPTGFASCWREISQNSPPFFVEDLADMLLPVTFVLAGRYVADSNPAVWLFFHVYNYKE